MGDAIWRLAFDFAACFRDLLYLVGSVCAVRIAPPSPQQQQQQQHHHHHHQQQQQQHLEQLVYLHMLCRGTAANLLLIAKNPATFELLKIRINSLHIRPFLYVSTEIAWHVVYLQQNTDHISHT